MSKNHQDCCEPRRRTERDMMQEGGDNENSEEMLKNSLECANLLGHIGNELYRRYLTERNRADLEMALLLTRKAFAATPQNHPGRAMVFYQLGRLLGSRYLEHGNEPDLQGACQFAQSALEMTPEDSPKRTSRMTSLANLLHDRFTLTGNTTDLQDAVLIAEKFVVLTPKDHPERAQRLHSLGIYLFEKSLRLGTTADLDRAILLSQESINITAENCSKRARMLANLSNQLSERFLKTNRTSDDDQAIQKMREALEASPRSHPDRLIQMNNLGAILRDSSRRSGNEDHFEEALKLQQEAACNLPEDHPQKGIFLLNLGGRCYEKYIKTGSIEYFADAIGNFLLASNRKNSPPIYLIRAGKKLLQCAALVSNWQEAYKAAKVAIDLIPKLVSRSLEHLDKQHMLGEIFGLASDATAVALKTGRGTLEALELLEQGRGVLAASLTEMRADIMGLKEDCPNLAERFVRLRNELSKPVVDNNVIADGGNEVPWQARANRRYEMETEFEKLIIEIRKQKEFENFLLAPTEADMKAAAKSGPIVIINMSKYRCDAILIVHNKIRSLPLPLLTTKEAQERLRKPESPKVLEWLWDVAASPVLDALGFTQPPFDDKWPYVWWIPTGVLSKAPLHAAGYHCKNSHETVLDRVISSYSSSVRAIIVGRQRRRQQSSSGRAVLVAMENTLRHTKLPFAPDEVSIVRNICTKMALYPIEPSRKKKEIVLQLQDCMIFHFAGHGYTHALDPSMSCLLLDDWESAPLRVVDLLEVNLSERVPFLAYLSACGTGRIRDEKFFDENIHLISACQLAGFRHVIGTLWEVSDKICVDMARIIYEGMRDGKMTDESVSRGLHDASRQPRAAWVRDIKAGRAKRNLATSLESAGAVVAGDVLCNEGVSEFPRDVEVVDGDGDEGLGLSQWIPFVHFGV